MTTTQPLNIVMAARREATKVARDVGVDADDLEGEILLAYAERLGRAPITNPTSYLHTIARRKGIDMRDEARKGVTHRAWSAYRTKMKEARTLLGRDLTPLETDRIADLVRLEMPAGNRPRADFHMRGIHTPAQSYETLCHVDPAQVESGRQMTWHDVAEFAAIG